MTVIDALYHPRASQCRDCGFRLSNKEALDAHKDWHFSQNSVDRRRAKQTMSRSWFCTADEWVTDTGDSTSLSREKAEQSAAAAAAAAAPEKKILPLSVASRNQDERCAVCTDAFEIVWDDTHDDWMCREAFIPNSAEERDYISGTLFDESRRNVSVQVYLDLAVHPSCWAHLIAPPKSPSTPTEPFP